MARYLRFLIAAGRGRGDPLLTDAMARRWTTPTVEAPGWSKGARYANGLAVVEVDGATLLHHTGGMDAYTSSFHVDPAAGVACFASTTFTGLPGYRPRDISSWACGLFRTARAGSAAPARKPTAVLVESPGDYTGVYTAADGERIEVRRAGQGLELAFGAERSLLEPVGEDALLAHHPRFERYAFFFERMGGRPVAAWWGEREYAAQGSGLRGPAPAELRTLAGRYDAPLSTTRIVARPTGLFADGTTPLARLPDGSWRVGPDSWTPERLRFDAVLQGRPQRLTASGSDSWRFAERD
jgi:D-alanyl-D-alanine carboxypeptidase